MTFIWIIRPFEWPVSYYLSSLNFIQLMSLKVWFYCYGFFIFFFILVRLSIGNCKIVFFMILWYKRLFLIFSLLRYLGLFPVKPNG